MGKKTFFVAFFVVIFGVQGLVADEAFTWHLALVKDGQELHLDDSVVSMDNGERFILKLDIRERQTRAGLYILVVFFQGEIKLLREERNTPALLFMLKPLLSVIRN
jgi:hypothetical protein